MLSTKEWVEERFLATSDPKGGDFRKGRKKRL